MINMSKAAKGIMAATLIVALLGLLSSISSSWAGLIPLLAGIGGMVVFLGLWLEKEADEEKERKQPKDLIDEEKRIKRKSEIGWRILMIGIGAEIIIGVGFAVRDDWKMRQIRNNEAKNAPLNQLISDAVVSATVEVKGTPSVDSSIPSPDGSMVELCDNRKKVGAIEYSAGEYFSTLGEFSYLYATEISRLSLNGNRGYVVKFAPFPPVLGSGFVVTYPPLVSDAVNNLHMLLIKASFIPEDAEVLGGSAYLVINGDIRMKFDILPQKTFKLPDGRAILPGFTLIATNGVVAPMPRIDR